MFVLHGVKAKEYMITGNTGIFKVEARESLNNLQLLAEGLKAERNALNGKGA